MKHDESDMGGSRNRGTQNGWFIMENPNLKWMIQGYPHFRKPPYESTHMQMLVPGQGPEGFSVPAAVSASHSSSKRQRVKPEEVRTYARNAGYGCLPRWIGV